MIRQFVKFAENEMIERQSSFFRDLNKFNHVHKIVYSKMEAAKVIKNIHDAVTIRERYRHIDCILKQNGITRESMPLI